MQAYGQLPIPCDVAEYFATPAFTNNAAAGGKDIVFTQALGNASAYITLPTDHYFAFCAFACKTNYDNFGGVFGSAGVAAAVIAQPSVPNAFEFEINRASDNTYANTRLTQAEVMSSGMISGKQNPIPVIYGPGITIRFTLWDLTGFLRLTEAGEAVPLSVQLWMTGFVIKQSYDGVPDSNFKRFLQYFPGLEATYNPPR